jgi:amino acid adenylation domain-containing protein
MVPTVWVRLDRLPVTATGKLDRRALPAPNAAQGDRPPSTEVEEVVAAIWSEVLGRSDVAADANFFDLGGHSLAGARVISRVRQSFGVDLPLRTIFETATLADLARRVEDALSRGRRELVPLARVDRTGRLELSYAQQRLFFLSQLLPDNPLYNIAVPLRLRGPLDVATLGTAFTAVVERHEVLRTRYPLELGRPRQEIDAARAVELDPLDVPGETPTEREAAARELVAEERRRPFDLERGPVVRAALLRLAADDHVLAVTIHHIAFDAWSRDVLLRDLAASYAGALGGAAPQLPPLEIQYADFAAWQRRWLDAAELEHQLWFWRRALADAPAALDLPTDRPRPAAPSYHGGFRPLLVPTELADRLRALARAEGATLFMTVLAGFKALLLRYTGQYDSSVGVPVAGRVRRELEDLVGFFVNTLVLRTQLDARGSFRDALRTVRAAALEAYAHQDVPFERLVEVLQPQRDLSRNPLVQVAVQLHAEPPAQAAVPGIEVEPFLVARDSARFDLELTLVATREGALVGGFTFATELFDRETVEQLATHLVTLLEGAAGDPAAAVGRLPLLDAAERQRLLRPADPPAGAAAAIPDAFEAQVRRTPSAVALRAGGAALHYGELNRQANRLARRLQAEGVGPERIVAVCLPRTPRLVVTLLAILKAGGAYLPLDARYPRERLQLMLADAGSALLLTERELLDRLPEARPRTLLVDELDVTSVAETDPPRRVASGSLAYVLYTSGSTGRPKGVALTHGGAAALIGWAVEELGPRRLARVAATTSVSFDLSVFELFAPLACGGCVVLLEDATELSAAGEEVTLVNTVPSAARALLAAGGPPPGRPAVSLAGEPLPRDLVEQLYDAGADAVLNLYGPTEDTTYSTWAIVPRDRAARVPIGRPLPGSQAYVLDPDLEPVPAGASGELYLGGVGLARGYLNAPDLTAERFVPCPWSGDGARLYRTGDVVRRGSDASLEYLGRSDDQVKIRGFRIEPGEVEVALRAVPGVREAAVAAAAGPDGAPELAAYVVGDAAEVEVREHLARRLPAYLHPAAILRLAALPLTPNGKVDRARLPAPSWDARPGGAAGTPPRTAVERALAEIWSEVMTVEQPGVDDDFFASGGQSLLAMQIVARARERFGIRLPLRTIFERPTIRALANEVERRTGAPTATDEGAAGGADPVR